MGEIRNRPGAELSLVEQVEALAEAQEVGEQRIEVGFNVQIQHCREMRAVYVSQDTEEL